MTLRRPTALLLLLLSCAPAAAAEDWPRLDLAAAMAAGGLPAPVEVAVAEDPVYEAPRRYRAIPLEAFLSRIPGLEAAREAGSLLVLQARDGYQAVMSLDTALAGGGYVAVADLDAPAGRDWTPFRRGGKEQDPGPFYLVWPQAKAKDWERRWPYQLAVLSLKPLAVQYGAAVPAGGGADVRRGFEVMRVHCLSCHAVNRVGGWVGPELNVPHNVTEYWREEFLPAQIVDSPSFRAGGQMPSFAGVLEEADVAAILAYLRHMTGQKLCATAAECREKVPAE